MLFSRTRLFALLVALLAIGPARAAATLVVGRASATAFTFVPLEIGEHAGIWQRNGLALKVVSFSGDAQLQQALTAGTIDIGLGSGPALAFVTKGVPAKAIAAFGGRPYTMCLAVAANSGIKTVDGLKGKKVGVTTMGSLTHWLVIETSRRLGWTGADAMVPVALGATRARLAAMSRGQISGHVTTAEGCFQHELDGSGRVIVNFGEVIPDFITHVFFARNEVIAKDPEAIRRFLTGWWQTIAYMKAHKEETLDLSSGMLSLNRAVVAKAYPFNMATLAVDGSFDRRALAVLSRSFVELKILPQEPDMSKLYTTQFLPVSH